MQNASKFDSSAVRSSFQIPLNTQQLKEELKPVTSTSTFERRNGLTYLINEHNQLRELMRRYEFEAKTIQQRMDIVPQITKLICQHLSMEEKFVYPLIRSQIPDGEFLYERLMLDDLQNKESLAVLERFVPTSINVVEFDKLMLKLIINEIEHLNEEELVLIPRLEASLSEEQLSQLELDLMNYKEKAPTHPHLTLLDLQFGPGQTGSVSIQAIEGRYDKMVDTAQRTKPTTQPTAAASSSSSSATASAAAPSTEATTAAQPTQQTTTKTQEPTRVQMPSLPAKTVLQHLSISRLTDTEKQAQTLRDNGVENLLDLLHKGKSRRDVLDLEKKTGIAHEKLIKLIHQADLLRVRGITTYISRLMVESGVRSVHDLARRVPSHLVVAMEEVNGDEGILDTVPDEEQVKGWIKQAAELPSMVEL